MEWDNLAQLYQKKASSLMRLVGDEFLACHLTDEKLRELGMAEFIGVCQRGMLVRALETARRNLIRQMADAEREPNSKAASKQGNNK